MANQVVVAVRRGRMLFYILRARAFFRRYHWLAEAPLGLADLDDSSETE